MKRHRVTRHCKSGKCVTYWRGKEGSRRFGDGQEYEKKFSSSRINRVNKAYDEAGVSAPKGKGIHTVAFHEGAAEIMGAMKKSGKGVNRNVAYAIAMKQLGRNKSVIARSKVIKIKRQNPPTNFREEDEVAAAYEQVGDTPNRNTKSWYRDIYEFYQNNEV